MSVLTALPIGSMWAHAGWKRPMAVFTVIAHDEGKAIIRCEDITALDATYRAVDQHEYDNWVTKMYVRHAV